MASILSLAAANGLYPGPAHRHDERKPQDAANLSQDAKGTLCAALKVMESISQTEKDARAKDLEAEGRRVQAEYGEQVGLETLRHRIDTVANLRRHLDAVCDIGGRELAKRLEAPFLEEHLCMERSLHVRMVEVVEGAFSDICSSKQDSELVEWSYTARVPVKELAKVQEHLSKELEVCDAACASIESARRAIKQLHERTVSSR